jgi:hypothetical protein
MNDGLPRYDRLQSYDWNYAYAPEPVEADVPAIPGTWDFCGLPVASPLGIAAGPLLNGRWVRYYASLGFDVLTYKTVARSNGLVTRCRAWCRSRSSRWPAASARCRRGDHATYLGRVSVCRQRERLASGR